jgi:hypothetical protein
MENSADREFYRNIKKKKTKTIEFQALFREILDQLNFPYKITVKISIFLIYFDISLYYSV